MTEREILDSWKEIADYLRREIRTCQRYERELGLPVHRLEGSARARVFAYKDEIDAWRTSVAAPGHGLFPRLLLFIRSNPLVALLAVVLALGLAALIYRYAPRLIGGGRRSEAMASRLANAVKVTSAISVEDYPTWSPDGLVLAYQSDQAGNSDIWIVPSRGGEAVNRTSDSPANELFPCWSPDGRWISFFSTRDGGGYFIMPAVGGRPRKVVDVRSPGSTRTSAQWSPESSRLAYAQGQRDDPWIEILTWESGFTEKLLLPKRARNNAVVDLSWSPDGRWLAYVRSYSRIALHSELWLTRVPDGESVQLTDGSYTDRCPHWSPDSREVYFVSDRGGGFDLWKFKIETDGRPVGAPKQVSSGLEMTHASLSDDGKKLAYTRGRQVLNAFRAPVLADRPATWTETVQLTFDEAKVESVDVSPDGRLVISSNRSGNWEIYIMPAGGGDLRALVTDPALDAGPRWSPDGREVAFYSSRTGHREIWVLPAGGGQARQLTRNPFESLYPAWSPDGSQIVKTGSGLSIVPAAGGEERRLTEEALGTDTLPDWSPDGRWIVFTSERDGTRNLWRVPASGGQAELLTKAMDPLARWAPRWASDGKTIYFIAMGDRTNYIGALSVDSLEERPLAVFTGRPGRIGYAGLATDGIFLYFTWEESRGDIWVADLIPPPGK